ncbi:MAG: lipoprotein [Gammaproteobacteria bacterium]|nr:lipoprotein [Gammaproteobacteria bacterium]
MQKIRHWKRLVIVCATLSLLVACGQKGDLYLPEGNALISWMG